MLTDLTAVANRLAQLFIEKKRLLVTAESCTGGWIAQAVTSVAGSSEWFERGYVCYSNLAKMELLGVSAETLQSAGAVSEACVNEMAIGAWQNSGANVAVATTGIAGPGGGTTDKPVGSVWFGWALSESECISEYCCFSGDREAVRYQAVMHSLNKLLSIL